VNLNQIPAELKSAHQWIVWKSEIRDGKPTKVPYQANGEMAQSNNRRSWSTFHTAARTFINGGYDGIGFMFSKDDPFIGIDIDHCVDDGVPNAFAQEIIDMMDSYTEFSPSGDGIHIIVKGSLPPSVLGTGKKNPEIGLEVYRYGRYFTFTGNRENEKEVNERTDELAELFQRYFKEQEQKKRVKPSKNNEVMNLTSSELWVKMFNSKNGSSIKALYNGELVNNDHSSSDLALCNHLAFWTNNDAYKMDEMFRESALMRDKWDKVHHSDGSTYGEKTIENAIRDTSTTVSDYESENTPYEIYISGDEENNTVQDTEDEEPFFRLTELGNAERIVFHHGEDIRFCNELEWLIWNGKHWEKDGKREIEAIAAKTLRKLHQGDKFEQAWAKKCERRSIRMNSILDMRPMVSVKKTEFDAHPYLFNCANGVVDLNTGKLLEHDRELLLTKISKVKYDNNAECPNWLRFLDSIFEGNQEIIDFLQKAIGYTLTGDISEQVMFFLYGNGRNGKSTFINTIQTLLGDYGRQTNSDTFIKKKNDNSINNDIARLDGARFVSAVESEEGQQLAESLVKQITGGEKISARFLRQEFFEFAPEFKVFFTTNHMPIVKNNDNGIWRRIRLVPFTVTIPKEKIDKELPKKLEKEMSGILKWAVEGCLKWQREGLGEPESVRKATENYREDMDILGPFLKEVCLINPLAKVETKVIYEKYKKWCFDNDESMMLKNRAFYRQLETRGFKKEPGAKNRLYFHGIGLQENPWIKIEDGVSEGVSENELTNPSKVTSFNRKKL
jgi:putative DNA primase/helicase